jgi:hypothetical protein
MNTKFGKHRPQIFTVISTVEMPLEIYFCCRSRVVYNMTEYVANPKNNTVHFDNFISSREPLLWVQSNQYSEKNRILKFPPKPSNHQQKDARGTEGY